MKITHTVGGQGPSIFRCLTGWLFTFAGFAAVAASAHAQTATVTGRVLNQGTGDYLKYAQVQIVGSEKSAVTEEGGVYTLTNVPAGEVKLSITYTGLDPQEVTITVPAEGIVKQDISMLTSDYGDTIKLGEFKVASAREGNAKAIVEQRVAMNLKTVIAADAFGDVAEGNVGEFLKLLPGVSVDYVDNDVRSTRIRGLPPKYTTTTMDGLPIANSGSNNAGVATGRQLELEQVSMAALDTLETTKSPTPDMMSANLAGNVNAIGKSAFNQKGRSIKYQGSVNFNQWYGSFDKSVGWDNQSHSKALFGGKVEWVDTFLDGKLGVVLSVAHSGAFADQRVTIGTQTWDNNGSNNATEVARIGSWNFQDGLKPTWRDSLLLNFDYKVSDELKLSLRTNYGYYRSEFYNRNWLINGTATAASTVSGATITATLDNLDPSTQSEVYARYVAQPTYRSQNGGTTYAVNGNANANSGSYARILGSNQRKSGGTFNISPAMNWKHDDLKVDLAANYSIGKTAYTSGQDGFFSLVQADMRGVSWEYARLADDNVAITQLNTLGTVPSIYTYSTAPTAANLRSNQGSIFDLGNYNTGGSVEQTRRNAKDQIWAAKGDVEIDFPDWKVPTTFKVGLADSLEVRDIFTLQAKWTLNLTSGATSATNVNLQDYRDPYGSKVGTITDLNGVTTRAPAPDKWALYRLFQSYGNTDPYSTLANGPFVAQYANNMRNKLQNDVDIKENIAAAYAMATVKPIKKLSVIAGLRFEKTKTEGRGFDDKGVDNTLAALGLTYTTTVGTTGVAGSRAAVNSSATGRLDYIIYRYGSRVAREKSYDNVLPIVQARYEITKNLIARAAYYSSILRPDFQSVIGGVTATESADASAYTFNINNTSLKPETARNLDASIEYYFEPVGLLSASVFYKDIRDIQISRVGVVFSAADPDVKEQILAAGYDGDPALASANTKVTTTINGPQTKIWGYELSYSQELSFLPSVLKGLGVTANYSHYIPEEERLWALLPNYGDGMALDQGNLILRYKLGNFKAQIAATWTDKRIGNNNSAAIQGLTLNPDGTFTSVSGANANVITYLGARWVVSPSAEYMIHKYATVFVSVNNIFNSAKFNYAERENYTTRYGNYGASITLGVKGSF